MPRSSGDPRFAHGSLSLALRRLGLATMLLSAGLLVTKIPSAVTPAAAPEPIHSREANPMTLSGATLNFEARVHYQRAIEKVYWRNRIWPAENPGAKPAFDQSLTDAQIRDRVETYLEKSAALEIHWSRPLSGEPLQAELNRMTRDTRNPDLLRELFAALDDDPYLIAECLARPVLVNRLARNWYSRDSRIHGGLRAQAETAITLPPSDEASKRGTNGEYSEFEWRIASDGSGPVIPTDEPGAPAVVELSPEAWRAGIARLAATLGVHLEAGKTDAPSELLARMPVGRLSPLTEENGRFHATAILSRQPGRVRIAAVVWRKRSFDDWWRQEGRESVLARKAGASVVPPDGGYKLRAIRGAGCELGSWAAPSEPPDGRMLHSAVWTGTEMIVWGGSDGWDGHDSSWKTSGGRYDPATDTWKGTSTVNGAPATRLYFSTVWTGTEMIVWGGRGLESQLNSGAKYDPATDSWSATSIGSGVPTAREMHTAVWTGSEMIVWGGTANGGYPDTGGRYDPSTDSWIATAVGGSVPEGRIEHTAVWTGTELILWGGSRFVGEHASLNSGGRYDPGTDSWTATTIGVATPSARAEHTAIWTGSEMIVWGGWDTETLFDDGARYDPLTDVWSPISTGPDVPWARYEHTGVWTGAEMIVWGGTIGGVETYTGGRYDPATDLWSSTSTGGYGTPLPRTAHSAVWTGTEMIVWGGERVLLYVGATYLDSGGRYDPSTDSWIPTAAGGSAEDERYDHEAVWTGTELIVWGGKGAGPYLEYLDTGGRYDPAIHTWTTTSTGNGVPRKRALHTAVWTGAAMVVWGGETYSGQTLRLDTGGRYFPATDTWLTTTESGAPQARSEHTAVWTGEEMIIWGGRASHYSVVDSGKRYDPITDSWIYVSSFGRPAARREHTAVWSGTEMIIWGGWPRNSGGKYNLAADRWTALSSDQEPELRANHTAVWTGSEMIVWGGNIGGYGTNTGGRYNPALDRWVATPETSEVPPERFSHTAIWTGSEMIVWGGAFDFYPDEIVLDTGGRYRPESDSWTATPFGTDSPQARRDHVAVWTGSEMIVSGGYASGALDSTALYCACAGADVDTWYPDADGDGYGVDSTGVPGCEQPSGYLAVGGDCDDRYAECTTECIDADSDGMPVCAPDCDDTNPNCTTDCTDNDVDGFCITTDCDDQVATCTTDCTTDLDADGIPDCTDSCMDPDGDGFGEPGAAGFSCLGPDCDEGDPLCNSDCTDADADGFCVTADCDDQIATCHDDCSDPDGDLIPDCRDNCPGFYNPNQTDADADSWGAGDGCDCDDTNAATYPDAPEVHDGLDNQCSGDLGYGLIDELSGWIEWAGPIHLEWPEQPGATLYEVIRSTTWQFDVDCVHDETSETVGWHDPVFPDDGICLYYLVRATQPFVGSWGADSTGTERTEICP